MFEEMLDKLIQIYGFEHEKVIEFAYVIEASDEFDEIDRDYVTMYFDGMMER